MSAPLHPLGDNIVGQAEAVETKTASGLYIPEKAQERPKAVKVVAVGPEVKQVKVGDRIVYKSFSSTEYKVGKEEFVIVKEEDVLATVK